MTHPDPGTLATDYANVIDNNYARGADLTGNADGSKGIASFWFFPVVGASPIQSIYNASPGASNIISYFTAFSAIRFTFVQPSAATALFMFNSFTPPIPVGVWHHILASWDLSVPVLHYYIDDVNRLGSNSKVISTIDYTAQSGGGAQDHGIGDAAPFGGGNLDSCLSEFYLNFSEFLDFSVISNRRLFIDAGGNPVRLGATGGLPTGTAPIMYFPDGDAKVNAGTGGNFALNGPAPVPCGTFPGILPSLTPRDVIEIVRDEIRAARIAETDKFLILRLDFAETFLTDALNFFDAGDLRKTAKGVRKAVKFLELAVEKGFSDAQVEEWGDRLCDAIREIASDEIDAASTANAEVTDVVPVANVAGSLQSTFFLLDTPGTDYYVWYENSSGDPGVDPLVAGRTGIKVTLTGANEDLSGVASATNANINIVASADLSSVVGAFDIVTVTNVTGGAVPDAVDGSAPTGFGLAVTTQGSDAGDPVKIAEAEDAFADGELEKLFMNFLDAIRDFEKAIKSAIVA